MIPFILIFTPIAGGATRLWSTTVLLLAEALIIFLWLWRANNNRAGYSFKRTRLDYPILIFAILATISFIFSIYKHDSFYALIKLFGYIGIYYVVVNECGHHMRKRLGRLIISVGTALSACAILQYMGMIRHDWWNPAEFPASTFVNHNHFAGYLELVIPITIAAVISPVPRENYSRLIFIPLLVIMVAAFILAQSRGAWLSLTVSLVAMFALFVKRGSVKRKNIIIFIIFLLIAASFIFFGKEIIYDRLSTLGEGGGGEASSYTRIKIWQGTLRLILHNPLIGIGIGDFIWAFPRFRPEGLNVTANFAHNDYLEMAAEMGVFAPIIFIWMAAVIIAAAMKKDSLDPLRIGCAAGALSLSLHGLVDFNFHIPANMLLFTIYAAMVMSSSRAGGKRL